MANALYDKGRQNILEGGIAVLTANIKFVFIDEGFPEVPDLALDDNLDDIAAGARVATSGNLASKTSTDGVFDAADVIVPTVSGASVESLTLYEDTGTESTSNLMCNIDSATGLPLTPNGADVTVQWDAGANRIFKL
jgi:hypothetical protein